MSDGEDTLIRILRDDPLIGSMLLGAFGVESSAEKEAKEIAKKREQAAQDDLSFRKATAEKNDASVAALRQQLFGGPPPPSTMPGPAQSPAAAPAPATPSEVNGFGVPVSREPSPVPLPGYTPAYDPNTGATVYYPPAGGGQSAAPAAAPAKGGPTKASPYRTDVAAAEDWQKRRQDWNQAWEDYNNQWTLPKAYAATEAEHSKSVDDFLKAISGIKDPALVGYVGDVQSEATVSPETLARQNFALDKLQANTDVRETAEEKLMRELARRKMEGQMKGDRDAMAQSLKSRGVYGSGAELASQLGSQSETASRRALEELAAQANAQQRAMAALGQYSTASQALGKQDLEQGRLHDIVNQSNQQLKQQGEQFKAKQQIEQNRDRVTRESNTLNARNAVTDRKDKHTNDQVNVATNLTGMETGQRTQGAQLVSDGTAKLDPLWAVQQASALANDETGKGLVLGAIGL